MRGSGVVTLTSLSQVHVALDDQTLETGGLHFVPGSHRWHRDGMPLPITDPKFGTMESIKSVLTEEELEHFKPHPSGLKRGQASFHHPLMVHGSYANRHVEIIRLIHSFVNQS